MNNQNETLADWGEFRIINEIILPAVREVGPPKALGDDCAFLPVKLDDGEELVVTTDAGPKPLSWAVGLESYWSWGWYSVVVNLSDLASAGSRVIAFATSIDAPSDMLVRDLAQFFDGVRDACREFGAQNAGGNIRAAPKFACHGMAIGAVQSALRIGRDGCVPGDVIVAIGECGQLMSTFLRVRAIGIASASAADIRRLTRPQPRILEMQSLGRSDILSAATDNSDGVLGSLWNIAERSSCGFELNIRNEDIPVEVKAAASAFNINLMNLMLCWGDWQIVATVRAREFHRFNEIARKENIVHTVLGTAIPGRPALYAKINGARQQLRVIRNENFTATSFNASLESNIEYMLRSDLLAV